MNRYSFSTERLLSLIPAPVRGDGLVRLMVCLLSPAAHVHALFTVFREKKEYRLAHTGQVFSLEQVIRDFCANDGCRITDGSYIDEVMAPYDGAGELANYQVWFPADASVTPDVTVPYTGMSQTEQSDFIVHLPAELYGRVDESSLHALVNEYKLAGKQFGIVYDGVAVETYGYEWGEEVCVKAEEQAPEGYGYEWGDGVCVLAATYTCQWKDGVCVRVLAETPEPYTCQWKDGVCVRVLAETPEPYTCQWKDGVCVRVLAETPEPYACQWKDRVCVQTDNDVKTT